MVEGKNQLFEIIDQYLNMDQNLKPLTQGLTYDNTLLKEYVKQENNLDNKIKYITKIKIDEVHKIIENLLMYDLEFGNKETIKQVSSKLGINESINFPELEANIKFIKNLVDIIPENNEDLKINESQKKILELFYELILILIDYNTNKINELNSLNETTYGEVKELKRKIENKEIVDEKEYDLVMTFVKQLKPVNANKLLVPILKFLNFHNSELIRKQFNIEDNQYENPKIIIEKEIFNEDSQAINKANMETFTSYQAINLAEAEKKQFLKELVSQLGYDYDLLDSYSQHIINDIDYKTANNFVDYLINEFKIKELLNDNYIKNLLYILRFSDVELFKNVINYLQKELSLSLKDIQYTLLNNTNIFSKEGFIELKQLLELYISVNISANEIKDNLILISANYKNVSETLGQIKKYNLNIKDLILKCSSTLAFNYIEIIKSLNTLESYGFNISKIFNSEDSYKVLNYNDLSEKIDKFIEIGLIDYLISDENNFSSNLLNLIEKRLEYAFQKRILPWKGKLNTLEFDKLISENNETINNKELENLVIKYPLLENLEQNFRVKLVKEDALNSRKYNLLYVINEKNISRLKVLRIFNLLIENNTPLNHAIMYSVIYNTNIEKNELDTIKDLILEKKEDE